MRWCLRFVRALSVPRHLESGRTTSVTEMRSGSTRAIWNVGPGVRNELWELHGLTGELVALRLLLLHIT